MMGRDSADGPPGEPSAEHGKLMGGEPRGSAFRGLSIFVAATLVSEELLGVVAAP
jgi:hypothetical protein